MGRGIYIRNVKRTFGSRISCPVLWSSHHLSRINACFRIISHCPPFTCQCLRLPDHIHSVRRPLIHKFL
jgi:hypothetical protein